MNIPGESQLVGSTKSKRNEKEAIIAIKLAQKYIASDVRPQDIAILTGYSAQANLLRQASRCGPVELRQVIVGTIRGFVGQEAPVIILSLTGTDSLGFLAEPGRLLVACSRARESFVILGNRRSLDASFRGRKCIASILFSRFDRLRQYVLHRATVPTLENLAVKGSDA